MICLLRMFDKSGLAKVAGCPDCSDTMCRGGSRKMIS